MTANAAALARIAEWIESYTWWLENTDELLREEGLQRAKQQMKFWMDQLD